MDEPTITDLSTREEAEEEIDFEQGEVGAGMDPWEWGPDEEGLRPIIGLLLALPCL